MGASVRVETDPLAAYRSQKSVGPTDPLSAYRASKVTKPNPTTRNLDLGVHPATPRGGATLKPPTPAAADITSVADAASRKRAEGDVTGSIIEGAGQVASAIRHPIETTKGLVRSAIQSARESKAPIIGGYKSGVVGTDATGLPIYDEHPSSDVVTHENTPDAVTTGQWARGAINTAANVALPLVPGGPLVRVGTNAALGAINDPDKPLRGATAGILLGEAFHGAMKVAPKVKASARSLAGQVGLDIRPASQTAASGVTETASKSPRIVDLQTSQIERDPSRFQFKQNVDAEGVGRELKSVTKYNPTLAGVLSVWKDPATGRTFVVNGHHRLELAERTNHPTVMAQYLDAATPEEARAQGALINIAEGRGTPLDAAQFFRNSGLGPDALAEQGVSLTGSVAKNGVALSRLEPGVFRKVATGQLAESHGAMIGSLLDTPEQQIAAADVVEQSPRSMSNAEVAEVAKQVRAAGTTTSTQYSMFGKEDLTKSLIRERATVAAELHKRLASDKKLFSYVSQDSRASELARAGNQINVEGSRQIGDEAATLLEALDREAHRAGPVGSLITDAARRIANGERARAVAGDIYPRVREAIQSSLAERNATHGSALEGGDRVGESAAGYEATGRQDAVTPGEEETGHGLDSSDPNQGGLLAPDDFEPGALRAPRPFSVKDNRGVNLSPSEGQRNAEPERLEVPAIRIDGEHVIEGKNEWDAADKAFEAKLATKSDIWERTEFGGYVTSHGRFVKGQEALRIAQEAGQIRRNSRYSRSPGNPSGVIDFWSTRNKFVPPTHLKGLRPPTSENVYSPVRGEIQGGIVDEPHIVSRALNWGNEEGEYVQPVEEFSPEGYKSRETGEPRLVVEGYQLSDDSFITREEAQQRFAGADIGPEGRNEKGGPLFSPEEPSGQHDFTDPLAAYRAQNGGAQESLFGAREGTAESRRLADVERAARSEVAKLRQVLSLEKEPTRRAEIARRIADHEKLLNRDRAITSDELTTRSIAEERQGMPSAGPDQGVLLSPASQATMLGTKIRKVLGVKQSVTAEVEALRKISIRLADAVGVPLREGRGNLKQMRALGAFWGRPEVIRVRRLKALDTVAHEVGHYLSKKYSLKGMAKGLPKSERVPIFKELSKMGHDLYGNRTPSGGYGEEGVAQWVRFLVTDRPRMLADAPTFTRYMDGVLNREPALRDILNKAHDDWQRYSAAPANAKIASMIERGLPSRLEGLKPKALIDHWFNDLAPMHRAIQALGQPTKLIENAGVIAELTKGNAGRARDMADNGVIDYKTRQRVTRGLREILKEIGEDNRDAFTEYLVSRQVLTKTGQGIDTGFDVSAAKEIVQKGDQNPAFVKAADDIWKYRNALLDYLSGAELMKPEEVAAIRKGNPTPTPFYRVFSEEGGGGSAHSSALARNSAGVYRMKGSDRPIVDPLQSIISDTYQIVDRAHKHAAALAIIKPALVTEGGGKIAEILPEAPKELRRIDIDRVSDQLMQAGWLPPSGTDLSAALHSGALEAFYPKARAGVSELQDNVMSVLINGERKWVQINDKATWHALQGLSIPELGIYERILTAPTRALRLGATQANPDFALINPFRDAFPAAIYSAGSTHLPGYHLLHGVAHLIKSRMGTADDLVARWAQEGGENAGMVGADKRTLTKEYLRNVHEMMRDGNTAFLDHLKHPVRTMREMFEIFENGTRLGEFGLVRSERMRAGVPETEANAEAAYSSRNVTQDFFKAGDRARVVNRYVPFFSAQLGDIYKLAQEFSPTKLATPEGAKRWATVTARATAYITAPSIALYLLQKDDPDYQEIPEYYKASAWVIVDKENGPIPFTLRSGKQTRVWALPRPYLLGYVFGYAPEKLLASIGQHDPDALADLGKQAWSAFAPSIVPTIAGPIIENYANKSLYSNRAIVSRQTEGLDPSEQSQPYTGETSRIVGKKVGYSPAKIENVVRGYTGGAGMFVKDAADATVRKARQLAGKEPLAPSPTTVGDPLDHTPVIGRFVISPPGANAKSVSKLFEEYARAEMKRQTWRAMLKAGQNQRAAAYLNDNRAEIASVASSQDAGTAGQLRQVRQALADLTKQRRAIAGSNLPPDAKAEKERQLSTMMLNVARSYYHKPDQGKTR